MHCMLHLKENVFILSIFSRLTSAHHHHMRVQQCTKDGLLKGPRNLSYDCMFTPGKTEKKFAINSWTLEPLFSTPLALF